MLFQRDRPSFGVDSCTSQERLPWPIEDASPLFDGPAYPRRPCNHVTRSRHPTLVFPDLWNISSDGRGPLPSFMVRCPPNGRGCTERKVPGCQVEYHEYFDVVPNFERPRAPTTSESSTGGCFPRNNTGTSPCRIGVCRRLCKTGRLSRFAERLGNPFENDLALANMTLFGVRSRQSTSQSPGLLGSLYSNPYVSSVNCHSLSRSSACI